MVLSPIFKKNTGLIKIYKLGIDETYKAISSYVFIKLLNAQDDI